MAKCPGDCTLVLHRWIRIKCEPTNAGNEGVRHLSPQLAASVRALQQRASNLLASDSFCDDHEGADRRVRGCATLG